jgi:hypothetical protein
MRVKIQSHDVKPEATNQQRNMTLGGMEMPIEEVLFDGLLIKLFVRSDPDSKHYKISCKAYDRARIMLWCTELLDQNGNPQTFHSIAAAITKSRSIFSVYKKEGVLF